MFDGGYAAFNEWKRGLNEQKIRREQEEKFARERGEKESSFRSKKERAEDAKRKARIKEIERSISALEEEENSLNAKLADPEITADYKKLNEITVRLQAIKLQLDALYSEYETVLE